MKRNEIKDDLSLHPESRRKNFITIGELAPDGKIQWHFRKMEEVFTNKYGNANFISGVSSPADSTEFITSLFPESRFVKDIGSNNYLILIPESRFAEITAIQGSHILIENLLGRLFREPDTEQRIPDFLEHILAQTGSEIAFFLRMDDDGERSTYCADPYSIIADRKEFSERYTPRLTEILNSWIKLPLTGDVFFQETNPQHPNEGYSDNLTLPCIFESKIFGILFLARNSRLFTPEERTFLREELRWLGLVCIISNAQREYGALIDKQKMQQQLESTATFADGIAHDINNLLSGMFGGIELLSTKLREPELVRLLSIIQSSALKVRDLSKGLLDGGKKQRKRFRTFAPAALLDEIEKYCTHSFPESIRYLVRKDDPLFYIYGDYNQIYQVIMNLAVNAKEAMNGQGFIFIGARNTIIFEENNAEYPLLKPGDYIHLTVQDDGPGIQRENLNKVFEPYFSTKGRKGGTGLGLSIVYSIIKNHNGTIEVLSTPGKGARFDVYLPAIRQQHHQSEQDFPIVVLVDDDSALRELLTELLESQGYQVSAFADGSEALHFLSEEIRPNLVISDYHLPKMNGIEMVLKLREQGIKVPVILTSGDSALEKKIIDFKSIGVHTLAKPYEFDELLALIDSEIHPL